MTDKEKIIQYLDFKGISKNKFYVKTGLSVGFLDSGNSLGVDKLRIIIDNYPDLNETWLITGAGNMIKNETTIQDVSEPKTSYGFKPDLKPLIPIDIQTEKGINRFDISESEVGQWYSIPEFATADFYIKVTGNSMAPKYSSGDTLACQITKETSFFQWGRTYVLDTENEVFIKKIKQSSEKKNLLLVSENPEFEPFEIPKSLVRNYALVIGKIVKE